MIVCKKEQIKKLTPSEKAKRLDLDGKDFFLQVFAPALTVAACVFVLALPKLCRGEEYVPATEDARRSFQSCMAEFGESKAFLEAGDARAFVVRTEDDRHLRYDSARNLVSETIRPTGSDKLVDVVTNLEAIHDETGPFIRQSQYCLRQQKLALK